MVEFLLISLLIEMLYEVFAIVCSGAAILVRQATGSEVFSPSGVELETD